MSRFVGLASLFVFLGAAGCGSKPSSVLPWERDGGVRADGGADGGELPWLRADGGLVDGGSADDGGNAPDAGNRVDGGSADGGSVDGGAIDGGPDGGRPDAGAPDAGAPDAGVPLSLDSTFVNATMPPRILPGASVTTELTLRNTGLLGWAAADHRLDSRNDPAALWTVTTAALSSGVAPGESFAFSIPLTAPSLPGVYAFKWQMAGAGGGFGATVTLNLEVTCDDGVFCNGIERFVSGACAAGPNPCDDGVECTTDTCDEVAKRCRYVPAASNCAACGACQPNCTNRTCGSNGCGGSCGTCDPGLECLQGSCVSPDGAGTCGQPLEITSSGRQNLTGNTNNGFNLHTPTCGQAGNVAREQVFSFHLDGETVVDAKSTGFDTLLTLQTRCNDTTSNVACNDDNDPPGWPGSRIVRALQAGDYFLIVDGFDANARGQFSLDVRFTPGTCIPQCDNKTCGADGCGGTCGTCLVGDCGSNGRCLDPCAQACEGKVCGSNGCGATCGTCSDGNICTTAGQCVPGRACDHLRPTCDPGCGEGEFCGNDCTCRRIDAPLPDLIIVRDSLRTGLAFETNTYRSSSCAVVEKCVAEPGVRKIMRFEVRAANVGNIDLTLGQPSTTPALYQWSPCHRHFHFTGFAEYELRDVTGERIVVRGRKQAFCLEDITRFQDSPATACNAKFTCGNQGIQRGWADVYSARLDCQWLDVTGVPSGRYRLIVRINPERILQEVTYDNNEAWIEVQIP